MTVVTHYKTEYDTSLNKTFQCTTTTKRKTKQNSQPHSRYLCATNKLTSCS